MKFKSNAQRKAVMARLNFIKERGIKYKIEHDFGANKKKYQVVMCRPDGLKCTYASDLDRKRAEKLKKDYSEGKLDSQGKRIKYDSDRRIEATPKIVRIEKEMGTNRN